MLISASNQYDSNLSFQSAGVVAVAVGECQTNALNSTEDNDSFDGHAYIDFAELSGNKLKAKAKVLKALAMERGWQYKNV